MRVLFLALMITLLPLRGWVGDVMAMERLGQALTVTPVEAAVHGECHAAHAHHGQGVAHGDMGQPAGHGSPHAQADCAGCTVCQICHSVALASTPVPAPGAELPAALPPSHARLYTSAEPVPGFKPPIS